MKQLGTNGSEAGRDVTCCVRLRGGSPLWLSWATPESKARGCRNRQGSSLPAALILQLGGGVGEDLGSYLVFHSELGHDPLPVRMGRGQPWYL